jgi:hypothetical protein
MMRGNKAATCLTLSSCVSFVLVGVLPTAARSADARRLCNAAQTRPRPSGAPKASDVITRSLRIRPINTDDSQDTLQALRDFHATTLAWAYIDDPVFIAKVKQSGRVFGGAASAPSYIGEKTDEDWLKNVCVLNRKGEVIIAPWKRNWKTRSLWGCLNNPELERGHMEYLKRYVDAGVDIMQRDEPRVNDGAVRWGGCFCDHCMKGFRQYLRKNTTAEEREKLGVEPIDSFDYRSYLEKIEAPVGDAFGTWDGGELKERFLAFQSEITVAFHQRTRKAIDKYAERRIPFSCNNGARHWDEVEMVFDWAFGELAYSHGTAHHIYQIMQEAAAHERRQIITMPKKGDRLFMDEWQRRTRQTIAMAYACGGHCMVPWDVYMPHDAPRYFGTPRQYADLFGFVRANSCYLDDYEQAEASGYGVPLKEQPAAAAVCVAGGGKISVNVRALPGKRDASVVVHLVDWSKEPAPFKLILEPERFFGDQPLRVRLLRPKPYDRAAHEAAEETASFQSLSQEMLLAEGRRTSVEIPALEPWGLLVVEPSGVQDAAVWQPAVWAETDSFFADRLAVRMTCPTEGATIHYTLDGREPDPNSLVCNGALEVTETVWIRAIAIAKDKRSPSVSIRFTRIEGADGAVAPDTPPLADALKLWLTAADLGSSIKDGERLECWRASTGPSAVTPTTKLTNGHAPDSPVFRSTGINGRPAVAFDGVDDQLVVPSFANEHLAGSAFTIFMVTQSESSDFGICGNAESGSGGIPRLYLTRKHYRYDDLYKGLSPDVPGSRAAISTFAHDGRETITAWVNGQSKGHMSGLTVVPKFGGGNLAMPFRAANRGQCGQIGEIIVYNRTLADSERRAVEAWLADRYLIGVRRWR